MEQFERQLSFAGLTINSDPSLRMQARPSTTGIAPGAGKPREDFGSSGFTQSPRKSKLNKTRPASTQSTIISINSSDDDGDIDFFDLTPEASRQRTAKVRTTTASGSRDITGGPAGVTYKGQVHEYHPDYLPKSKLPNFKKNKPANQTEGDGDNTSSRPDASNPKQKKPAPRNPPLVPKRTRQTANKEIPPASPPRSSQPSSSPPPKTRPCPRPRPIAKPPTRAIKRVDSSDSSDNPVGDRVDEDLIPSGAGESAKPVKKGPKKHVARLFPLLNNPSFQPDQPFRVVSNLSSPRSYRPSPEAASAPPYDLKGKDRALAVSDEDAEDPAGHVPQPFPLSTGFMNSTPKAPKRHPEDGTHSGESERKKFKESLSNGLSPVGLPSVGDRNPDLFFLDPNVDPATLCPWCDRELPTDPTPRLKSLIESVRFKSYPSPRPTNPLGLHAPLTTSVTVCQRHHFESHQIPKAQAKGWPTKIDFGKVKPRVEALRSKLEALVLNKSSDVDDLILLDEDEENPRDTCPFWMEMMKEVKSKGTRVVASSKGQFANFKTLQPGYYGELGYLIIHQTIYQLFPPDTIEPDSITPLTPADFIQRILVPEVAVRLIMEDLHSTYASALKTLRESVEYGVAMFPDTGGDNEEGTKAADEVVKERARARRKQLLEEEIEIQQCASEMEVELEIMRPSTPPEPSSPKKSRSKRGKAGGKFRTDSSESEQSVEMVDLYEPHTLAPRPPTTKSRKPTSGYRSDASNASNASLASRASTRSMTRKQTSKIEAGTLQTSDPPLPPPASQPPKRKESGVSYRVKTPSDRGSDVEIVSDHSTRSTRRGTRGGTKPVPQQPPGNSKSADERSTKPAHTESAPHTDPDDELLDSSPFNVGRYLSRRTLSTEIGDLEMDETPKPQKTVSMKLNPDPWGVSKTPTRKSRRLETHSSQDLAHLLDGD